MNKKNVVLMVLASVRDVIYTPVQVQKLFFLIDRNLTTLPGAPFFNFVPYDYGPFDKEVYSILRDLSDEGFVRIDHDSSLRLRRYMLTPDGQRKGESLLLERSQEERDYINRLSYFVTSLSFAQLVSAIYKEYPEMKSNSVFKG